MSANRHNKWTHWRWIDFRWLISRDRSGLLWGLVVSALVAIPSVVLLPVKYDVNDDFGMVMALSGIDGFPAGEHGWFISKTLSKALCTLYAVAPAIPWYGVFLYSGMWLAGGLALSTFWYGVSPRRLRILILPAWGIALGHCLLAVTFTSVTLWLELGVFLYLLRWAYTGRGYRPRWCLASGALMLAYLWRAPLAIYFWVFALPLVLYAKRSDVGPVVRWIAPCLLLVGADQTWSYWQGRTGLSLRYATYSRQRAQFHDRPSGRGGPHTETAIRQAGWLRDDYELYRNRWFLYDEERFNEQRITQFLRHNRPRSRLAWTQIGAALNYVWDANRNFLPLIGCVFLALILFRWAELLDVWRRRRLPVTVTFAVPFALLLFLAWYRMPSRISLPLMIFLLGTLSVLAGEPKVSQKSGPNRPRFLRECVAWGLFTVACYLGVQAGRADRSSLTTERARLQFVQTKIRELGQTAAEPPLLIRLDPRNALSFDAVHPLRERLDIAPLRLLPAGSWIRSPRYYRILEQLGVKSGRELLRFAIDKPSVLFVLYIPQDVSARHEAARTLQLWESYIGRYVLEQEELSGSVEFHRFREFVGDRAEAGRLMFYRLHRSPLRRVRNDTRSVD